MTARTSPSILSLGLTAARNATDGVEFSSEGQNYTVFTHCDGSKALKATNIDRNVEVTFWEYTYRIAEKVNTIGIEWLIPQDAYTTGIQEIEFPGFGDMSNYAAKDLMNHESRDSQLVINIARTYEKCKNILERKIRELYQLDERVTFEEIELFDPS